MSEPITFKQWMDQPVFIPLLGRIAPRMYLFNDEEYDAMMIAWDAAHENAAAILESQCAYTDWNEQGRYAAEQIREAAK